MKASATIDKKAKEDIAKSKSIPSKKEPITEDTPSKAQLLKLIAIIFVIAGILGAIALGIVLFVNRNKIFDTSKIKIENIDPKLAQELTGQLVYTGDQSEIDYYSPTIDSAIKYSKEKFFVSEGYKSITISPRQNDFSIFANLYAGEKGSQDPLNERIEYYKGMYSQLQVFDSTEIDEGIEEVIISYTRKSGLTEEDELLTHSLLYLVKDNNYALLDIREQGDGSSLKKYKADYLSILKSVQIKPENIETTILVQMPLTNLSLEFDRKTWEIMTHNESTISAQYINDTNDPLRWNAITSIYIYSYQTTREINEDILKEMLVDDLNSAKERFTEDRFRLIDNNKKETFGSTDFYYDKYVTKDKWDDSINHIVINRVGYNPTTKTIISIKVKYPENEERFETAINDVVKTIDIQALRSTTNDTQAQLSITDEGVVLGTSTIELEKATLLSKAAVVRIFNRSCTTVAISRDIGLSNTGGKKYNVCLAGFGSGFYVNDKGDIATNAHVASPNPLDIAADGIFWGYDQNNLFADLTRDTFAILNEYDPDLIKYGNIDDPQFQQIIVGSMLTILAEGHKQGYITFENTEYTNHLQGTNPFIIDEYTLDIKFKDDHNETTLLAYNEIESTLSMQVAKSKGEDTSIKVPDLAIIQRRDSIQKPRLAIKLSNPDLISSGQTIYVVGFPGAANNQDLFSAESSNIPTITKGTISAVKPNASKEFDLIQIDASISGGNSGGPIVNEKGEIIGVATYGINTGESADFNVGVSVKELKSLLEKNNITLEPGNISKDFESGINNLAKGYYKWAIDDLQKVTTVNQDFKDLIDPLIRIAQDKIDSGEDNTPIFSVAGINIHKTEALIGGLVITLLLAGILLLVLIKVISIARKKSSTQSDQIKLESVKTDSITTSPITDPIVTSTTPTDMQTPETISSEIAAQAQQIPSSTQTPIAQDQNTNTPTTNTYAQSSTTSMPESSEYSPTPSAPISQQTTVTDPFTNTNPVTTTEDPNLERVPQMDNSNSTDSKNDANLPYSPAMMGTPLSNQSAVADPQQTQIDNNQAISSVSPQTQTIQGQEQLQNSSTQSQSPLQSPMQSSGAQMTQPYQQPLSQPTIQGSQTQPTVNTALGGTSEPNQTFAQMPPQTPVTTDTPTQDPMNGTSTFEQAQPTTSASALASTPIQATPQPQVQPTQNTATEDEQRLEQAKNDLEAILASNQKANTTNPQDTADQNAQQWSNIPTIMTTKGPVPRTPVETRNQTNTNPENSPQNTYTNQVGNQPGLNSPDTTNTNPTSFPTTPAM